MQCSTVYSVALCTVHRTLLSLPSPVLCESACVHCSTKYSTKYSILYTVHCTLYASLSLSLSVRERVCAYCCDLCVVILERWPWRRSQLVCLRGMLITCKLCMPCPFHEFSHPGKYLQSPSPILLKNKPHWFAFSLCMSRPVVSHSKESV